MALRTITYTITDALAVTPTATQQAGVQGDDNATLVQFKLPSVLQTGYLLRVVMVDSQGCMDTTEPLSVKGTEDKYVEVLLPLSWTQHGGDMVLRLMASRQGETTETAYSFEGKLRFKNKPMTIQKALSNLGYTLLEFLKRADEAEQAAQEAVDAQEAASAQAASAKASAAAAEQSATNASNAASAAGMSRTAAEGAAATAAEKATAAITSAAAAQTAQTAAEDAADTATDKATAAVDSAADAQAAQTAAEGAAATAAEKAAAAVDSAAAAEESATNAALSERNAAASASDAGDAADTATDKASAAYTHAAAAEASASTALRAQNQAYSHASGASAARIAAENSANAAAASAAAAAAAAKGMRLIKAVTMDTDTASLEISTDTSGAAFALRQFAVYAVFKGTYAADHLYTVYCNAATDIQHLINYSTIPASFPVGTPDMLLSGTYCGKAGSIHLWDTCGASTGGYTIVRWYPMTAVESITKFIITSGLKAGDEIYIYGIDAS